MINIEEKNTRPQCVKISFEILDLFSEAVYRKLQFENAILFS
jgi:hypothetical protein